MASLADHAYSHCRAVLGEDPAAADLAALALRRGGRSRSAVLSFARAAVVAAATDDVPTPAEAADVSAIALALAATRPPIERAVVDLGLRHELDRGGFGRALGLAPAVAAERLQAVSELWATELDPALLAWLGPGDCAELADVLAEAGPLTTIPDLVAAGPAVAAHASECDRCTDRRRAMVGVAPLVGQRPLDMAPAEVAAIARRNRLRPPAPAPPSIESTRPRRWPRVAIVAGIAAALSVVGVGTAALAQRPSSQDRRNHRVAALTKVDPTGSALSLSPTVVRAESGTLLLRNSSPHAVNWQASTGAAWVTVSPVSGRLEPGTVIELATNVASSAPEGDLRSTVTVTGDDGSATGAVVETTVEHPPTVAATIDGCNVSSTVDDQGSVTSVLLHWRSGPTNDERTAPMATGQVPNAYVGNVVAGSHSWWVSAVDDRGNRAITSEQPVTNC